MSTTTEAPAASLKVPATIRIDEQLWKRAKKEAIDRGCTASELAEQAIAAHLGTGSERKARK